MLLLQPLPLPRLQLLQPLKEFMMRKHVFITPMGGHGTTYIHRHIGPCAKRPDVLWGEDLNIREFPAEHKAKAWAKRTRGHILNPNKSIESNLCDMINSTEDWVLLSGWCSIRSKFLTENDIEAFCLVRHPLHAYVSYFGHQHPNHCRSLGGFNTAAAVRKWTGQWNSIVSDFLSSKGKLIRYEYFYKDLTYYKHIRDKLSNFDTTKRNYRELKRPLARMLKDLVADNFFQIYDEWKI